MGWATGHNVRGEKIGYGVSAVCEYPGCHEKIDKGLSYCCGGLAGVDGEWGCGHYFCDEHLFYGDWPNTPDTTEAHLCQRCAELPIAGEARG